MDSSCSVLLIAAVTDTGDVGVNVAREVVEEEYTAHHVLELAASMCRRSFSAIAQSLFPNAGMAPLLSSFMNTVFMNTVRVYPPNGSGISRCRKQERRRSGCCMRSAAAVS
jgi:hypothetical protein